MLVSAQDNKGGVSLGAGATFRGRFYKPKSSIQVLPMPYKFNYGGFGRISARVAIKEVMAIEVRGVSYLCRFSYNFCLSSPLATICF